MPPGRVAWGRNVAVTAMSTAVGASLLAHGLHYAMVLAGLWGLAALLLPHALDRLAVPGSRPAPTAHDQRVAALRAAVASGAPGIPTLTVAPPVEPEPTATPAFSVPLALVSSTAAAGIHAAVVPPHLRGEVAAGAFLLAAAVVQLAWAAAAQRPTARLLATGVAVNLGLVAVWLVSRTTGLPFAGALGIDAGRHPVGAWDLTCVAFELLAVAACWRVLRDGVPARCPGWFDWHPTSRAAVGAAAVSLVLLTLAGAHS